MTTTATISLRRDKLKLSTVLFMPLILFMVSITVTRIVYLARYNSAKFDDAVIANKSLILVALVVIFILSVPTWFIWNSAKWHKFPGHEEGASDKAMSTLAVMFSISTSVLVAVSAISYGISLCYGHNLSPKLIKNINIILFTASATTLFMSVYYIYNSYEQRSEFQKIIFTASMCTAVVGIVTSAITLSDSNKALLPMEAMAITMILVIALSTLYSIFIQKGVECGNGRCAEQGTYQNNGTKIDFASIILWQKIQNVGIVN